jgi:hypothetical protein
VRALSFGVENRPQRAGLARRAREIADDLPMLLYNEDEVRPVVEQVPEILLAVLLAQSYP